MPAELSAALVLASASPRRAELLRSVGIPFSVEVSDVDESAIQSDSPSGHTKLAAELKARDVLGHVRQGAFVLGADTVVAVDSRTLGKPRDDAEATAMLHGLLGRDHDVVTSVSLGRFGGILQTVTVMTRVRFRSGTDDEVRRYVASREGRDKAGAYAIQGLGAGFVDEIDGSYTNVVGLPIAHTLRLLRAHQLLLSWP